MKLDLTMPLYDSYTSFEVEEGVVGLSIEFECDKDLGLNYMVYDPDQTLVGQHMCIKKEGSIWLGTNKAMSSAYALPLRKTGIYTVYNVLTALRCLDEEEVRATIKFYKDPAEYEEAYLDQGYVTPVDRWYSDEGQSIIDYSRVPENRKEKRNSWFKGDLHSHTEFSDGQGMREDSNYIAKDFAMDFFFPSDHLIFPYEWPKTKDVLVLPSSEITTIYGHFNYYFGPSPYAKGPLEDFSKRENVVDLLKKVEAILTVNHPYRGSQNMKLDELDLHTLDGLEVINSPFSKRSDLANIRAAQAWSRLWNMGWDYFGRGGSDAHVKLNRYDREARDYVRMGKPQTFFYGEDLSGNSLKKAMEEKNLVFSVDGRPCLKFTDDPVNGPYRGQSAVGKRVDLEKVDLSFSLYDCEREDLSLEWIVDGHLVHIDEAKSAKRTFTTKDIKWIRVDIRDGDQRLFGSVNPLRVNESEKRGKLWGDIDRDLPKVRALIFDLNGTLIHYNHTFAKSIFELFLESGLGPKEVDAGLRSLGLSKEGRVLPGSGLGQGNIDTILDLINTRALQDFKREDIVNKFNESLDDFTQNIRPRTDLKEFFAGLKAKDFKLGLVCDNDQALVGEIIKAMDLGSYLDFYYGGNHGPKPKPGVLMDIARDFSLHLDEMAFVGDTDTDMRFGSYTQKTIAIRSDASSSDLKLLADGIINELEEVFELI